MIRKVATWRVKNSNQIDLNVALSRKNHRLPKSIMSFKTRDQQRQGILLTRLLDWAEVDLQRGLIRGCWWCTSSLHGSFTT